SRTGYVRHCAGAQSASFRGADHLRGPGSASGLPHGCIHGHRCRSAAQSRQIRNGRITPMSQPPPNPNGDEHIEIVLPAPPSSPGRRLVNWFLAGLVLTGPIAITLYLAWTVIGWIDSVVVPLVPTQLNPATY